jgi:hypothetical protein
MLYLNHPSPLVVELGNIPLTLTSNWYVGLRWSGIRVITKLPNSEQSYKGKVKTHKYINRQNQSTTENCENRNDPDLVQAFLKKWWVESDFKAPNLPLSLRLKVSGCHYNSIYNNTWTKQINSCQTSTKLSEVNVKDTFTSHIDKRIFWNFCWHLIFIHFHYMKIHRL